jgi:NAD(P)-dependent dehydrogenase (short-subunit alcohol dehydrogenase family)
MSENYTKVAVVTGSSSGIGFETCLELGRNGFIVCATMRDTQKSKGLEKIAEKEKISLKVYEMDVNHDYSVKNTISDIVRGFGRIDVLVNNAGYGLFGAVEDLSIQDIKGQFETNVFGIVRVIQNVLPTMRMQRNGTIVNVSSLAGIAGFPSQSIYCGTKYAVEGISEALSYELDPFGIKVVLIEPGVINTEFVQDLIVPDFKYNVNKNDKVVDKDESENNEPSESPYNKTIAKFLGFYYNAMSKAPGPKLVATEILSAYTKVSSKKYSGNLLRIPIGSDSTKYSKLKKELSDTEFHNLIIDTLLK